MPSSQRYTSKQLFAVFWPFLRPHRGRIALAILALVLIAGALLGMGRGLAYLVDEGLGKRDPALLDRAVMATVLIAITLAFGSYLRASMVNKIGEMVLADIRRAMFGHAINLSAGWFENFAYRISQSILARVRCMLARFAASPSHVSYPRPA